jgi:hypothetical protein
MLNEGNKIHNFLLCVYENFCDTILLRKIITVSVPNYLQVTAPVPVSVPVPYGKQLRFLRFRFRFHNTAFKTTTKNILLQVFIFIPF